MFKDLKEYHEITQLYYDSVNISEEQRAINKIFIEEGFTLEEIEYLEENFDELWESGLSELTEECVVESIREENLTEEQLDEILGLGAGVKLAGKLAKKAAPMLKKGLKAAKTGVKDTLSGAKEVGKSALKKVGGVVKKAGKVLSKVPGIALPVAAVGGVVGGINALRKKGKEKREANQKAKDDAAIKKGIEDAKKTGIPNNTAVQGGAMSQKAREQAAFNRGERKARVDLKDPTLNDNMKKKTDPPKATETKPETKKKKMHPIEKKNRARFGDEAVDKKKAMNVDFKKMRSKEMSKDEFIKKYPNSITAQKAKGLRDHTEWDAYDMVLEYLFSTEQVESLEEANYVMMEMDHQTIGEIVKEVQGSLIEEGLAKAAMKLGALAAAGYGVKKGAEKLGTMVGSPNKPNKKKGGLIKKLKDRKAATEKAIEQM